MQNTNNQLIAVGRKVDKIKHMDLNENIQLHQSISDLLKLL